MTKLAQLFGVFFLSTLLVLGLFGCDKNKKKEVKHLSVMPGEKAEDVFAKGEAKLKKKQYEEAIGYFEAVRNNFPQSEITLKAELKTGEAYLAWRQYNEAADAFERFRKMHPLSPQADYAMLKQGESHFKDAPRTIDRDLTQCHITVDILNDFFVRYPESQYVPQAHEMVFSCRQKMAGQEYYIGRFYYRTHHYKAAAGRLEGVLQGHTGFGYDEKAAWYLGLAYLKLKAYEDADRVFTQLVDRYPDGKYHDRAQKKIGRKKGKENVNDTIQKTEKSES